jgi:Ca2+-binding RTX toxin-like protein
MALPGAAGHWGAEGPVAGQGLPSACGRLGWLRRCFAAVVGALALSLAVPAPGVPASAAGNLVINGDFSGGNVGFSTEYEFLQPSVDEGTYTIGRDPADHHPLFASYGDHTTGNGRMMIVNGAEVPGKRVWSQTLTVVPGSVYEFSLWVATAFPESPAVLRLAVNGAVLGTGRAPTDVGIWRRIAVMWHSGSSTSARLSVVDANTDFSGNDFTLDDMSFSAAHPACTIRGTAGNDDLRGTAGDDVVCGFAGHDTLLGLGGRDHLYGGSGDDHLDGGSEADHLIGGLGVDVLSGGAAADYLDSRDEVAGNDSVSGGTGQDVCVTDPADQRSGCP